MTPKLRQALEAVATLSPQKQDALADILKLATEAQQAAGTRRLRGTVIPFPEIPFPEAAAGARGTDTCPALDDELDSVPAPVTDADEASDGQHDSQDLPRRVSLPVDLQHIITLLEQRTKAKSEKREQSGLQSDSDRKPL